MSRHKNADWDIPEQPNMGGAQLSVLMDIRDELKKLNDTIAPMCHWKVRESVLSFRRMYLYIRRVWHLKKGNKK